MYTEFHFNAEMKRDVPEAVLAVLRFMVDQDAEPAALPDHPLFRCKRWRSMLTMDSYYFDADTHSTLRLDAITGTHYLCIRCNLKNYDGEIDRFVHWVSPYLNKHPGEFLGFSRYEEFEEPIPIYSRRLAERSEALRAGLVVGEDD